MLRDTVPKNQTTKIVKVLNFVLVMIFYHQTSKKHPQKISVAKFQYSGKYGPRYIDPDMQCC